MAVTGWKESGTQASVDRSGGGAWSNPANASGSDNARATASAGGGAQPPTDWLRLTNFGFTDSDIPPGSTIDGIEVEIERQGTTGQIRDSAVFLRKSSGQVGNNIADTTNNWPTTDGTKTYGGPTALHGTTWTDAEIKSTDFGIDISALRTVSGTATAEIDNVRIRVYYTEVTVQGAATLTATATLTASARSKSTAAATLTATAALDADGRVLGPIFAAASLTATATLTASARSKATAAASLTASATLSASAHSKATAAASLQATATLSAAAMAFVRASATLIATATLTARAGTPRVFRVITLPRVLLHDGQMRRIGELITVRELDRSYALMEPGVATFQLDITDPLIRETDPLLARVVAIESEAYPYPWVGKVVQRSGDPVAGSVTVNCKEYSAVLGERRVPTGYVATGEGTAALERLMATVNRRNETLITLHRGSRSTLPALSAISASDASALEALNTIAQAVGAEWWFEYHVSPRTIEAHLVIEPRRGRDLFRQAVLLDGANCLVDSWSEDGEAFSLAAIVVGGAMTPVPGAERDHQLVIHEAMRGRSPTLGLTRERTDERGIIAVTIGRDIHGYVPLGERSAPAQADSPATARERLIAADDLLTSDVLTLAGRELLREPGLSDKVASVYALYDPETPEEWRYWEVGNVVRFVSEDAFVVGFDGPARILAAQPQEDEGTMALTLELLAEAR